MNETIKLDINYDALMQELAQDSANLRKDNIILKAQVQALAKMLREYRERDSAAKESTK